jgi:GDP-mannose 6-dehydrogenase
LNISIFGLGYVGAVSLGCLIRDGHHVIGVDINQAKLDLITAGISPVIENGMPELMKAAADSGRVQVTTDARAAVRGSALSFITVGTPSSANGSVNLGAVFGVTRTLGEALAEKDGYHLFVFRSTIAPGTTECNLIPALEKASGKRAGVDFDVCFQPEFLREGSSIRDYDHPPFIVLGGASERAFDILRELFGHIPAPFQRTTYRAAELLKVCCNNFHAVKITFANEVARLCEAVGCDPFEVMRLVCEDRQLNISPAYLKPGFAFGGSCLPKDLRSSLYIAKTQDVEMPLLTSVLASNRLHIEKAIQKILDTGKTRVGLIGLSFKTGTDDLRESPTVIVAEHLLGKGIKLSVYDPEVEYARLLGANREYIEHTIPHLGSLLCASCEEVVERSEVVVVTVTNPDVLERLRRSLRPDQLLIDLAGIPHKDDLPCRYAGLSW